MTTTAAKITWLTAPKYVHLDVLLQAAASVEIEGAIDPEIGAICSDVTDTMTTDQTYVRRVVTVALEDDWIAACNSTQAVTMELQGRWKGLLAMGIPAEVTEQVELGPYCPET